MVLSNEDFQQLVGLFDIKLNPISQQLGDIEGRIKTVESNGHFKKIAEDHSEQIRKQMICLRWKCNNSKIMVEKQREMYYNVN